MDYGRHGLGGIGGGDRPRRTEGVGVERCTQGRSYENRSIGYSFRLLRRPIPVGFRGQIARTQSTNARTVIKMRKLLYIFACEIRKVDEGRIFSGISYDYSRLASNWISEIAVSSMTIIIYSSCSGSRLIMIYVPMSRISNRTWLWLVRRLYRSNIDTRLVSCYFYVCRNLKLMQTLQEQRVKRRTRYCAKRNKDIGNTLMLNMQRADSNILYICQILHYRGTSKTV